MSLEDPFFVVRDEVLNALAKSRNLYDRWAELNEDPNAVSREEIEWNKTELRNSLRSIEWDLEDLDETIGIVESNPKKFKLDEQEIISRRTFINDTREEVKSMREKVFDNKSTKRSPSSSLIFNNSIVSASSSGAKYSRLQNQLESPQRIPNDLGLRYSDTSQQFQRELESQGDKFEKFRESVSSLKNNSRAMNVEEQAVMLDDAGGEIEIIDSRMDSTLKKVARVLHLHNERRQWTAIGLLSSGLVVVVLLIIVF